MHTYNESFIASKSEAFFIVYKIFKEKEPDLHFYTFSDTQNYGVT